MKLELLPGAWTLEAFRRGGVDIEELTRLLPDDVREILYHINRISPERVDILLTMCAKLSGNKNFGLTMNERIDVTMYGLFGYLLLNSSTVQDLFNTIEHYYPILYAGGASFKIVNYNKQVHISFITKTDAQASHRHLTEWSLGFIPYYLQIALGEIGIPQSAHFTHKEVVDKEKLSSVFGPKISFDQDSNQLFYPRSILKQHLSNVDAGLLKILRVQADKALRIYIKDDSLAAKIRLLLLENLGIGDATAAGIAHELNLTLSTFKRKLGQEKIDFKQIKASVRNDLAIEMLSQTRVSINDIARKTGFSDQSSFTRFFIRCNHTTPKKFRQQH
ncbi:AraC family transcriptional regulator [sulfur-oxidizing endosymbiont of Gigantopelta aegis]|uniref:AraC family transcriptional regulator n=1 Tax=sulfur-oxidizing endosymbiont of Gigantopelta aegis TaxID=2794934 RepID=UPI0018DDF62B|nr:AraC family transcriptional regulator [sulfur-oxidizing endosymbiont of Gigantopelta aegis]